MNIKTFSSKIIMIIILFFGANQAQAQNVDSLNYQLRHLFSTIAPPNPNTGYLYDMAVHIVDSAFYGENCPYPSNTDNWFSHYEEIRNMAYDTIPILRGDTVFARADRMTQADTIPLGFLELHYNILKPDALTTNTYFNFDTINDILTDISGAPSPYNSAGLFHFAPLASSHQFRNVTFAFDPQFYFIDASSKADLISGASVLKINFGDGNGFQIINYNAGLQYFNITYPNAGTTLMQALIYKPGRSKFSSCEFTIGTKDVSLPSIKIPVKGLDVNMYSDNCVPNPFSKVVIYLEGIDPLENRGCDQIYSEMLASSQIAQLRNLGYSFVVVSWKSSGDDIRTNAMRIVELINYLKCQQEEPEPFVIIGESMGGLVARYALCYMESPAYQSMTSQCNPRMMHNTRLFISQDAPNQGANIPLGVQHAYYDAEKAIGITNPVKKSGLARKLKFLDATSARQMLLYHASTESGDNYTAAPEHDIFFDDLASIGNYPRFCKNVTMANGSMGGVAQSNIFNNPRTPNDLLLDVTGSIEVKILGIKRKIFENKITVRTNPNGAGNLYSATAGTLHYKIKLKFWGIKIKTVYTDLHNVVKNGKGILPYCVNAGSVEGYPILQHPNTEGLFFDLLSDLQLADISGSPGNLHFSSTAGIPWVTTSTVGVDATTEGFYWCFIPTKSAIDYQLNPTQLDENIIPNTSADLNTLLNNQPFDLIIGNWEYDSGTFFPFMNFDHLHQRQDKFNLLQPCASNAIASYLINREIGDDTLIVDNMTLNRNATYGTQENIQVNTFNHIKYDYQGSAPNKGYHLYSRRRPFQYQVNNPSSYHATFNSGISHTVLGVNGTYQTGIVPITNCCVDYGAKMSHPPIISNTKAANVLEIFPNPANTAITLHYRFKDNGNIQIRLSDLTGKLIATKRVSNIDATVDTFTPFYFDELSLKNGLYLLSVDNGKERMMSKFIKE